MRKVATNFRFEVSTQIQNAKISNDKAPRRKRNGLGNSDVAPKVKKSVEAKITLNSEVLEGKVIITLPIRTVSELNCSEGWRKKHERHKMQKRTVSLGLSPVREKIPGPCHVHLVRYAPRKLNAHDNLPGSMKYIVDACCAIITGDFRPGRADDDERFTFSYDQVVCSQYGVKVEFTF